jgi:hypothetical protein
MNSGNKIRGAWKKAEKEGDVETLERIKFVLGLDQDDEQDDSEIDAPIGVEVPAEFAAAMDEQDAE